MPSPQRILARRNRWLLAIVFVVAATWLNAQEATPPRPNDTAPNRSPDPAPGKSSDASKAPAGRVDGYLAGGRWREGSKLVDMPGQFKISGDRAVFLSADGKSQFACLENLNSERIARMVAESPETLDWEVQGTITEYRNENYVLITQAVIKSRSARSPRTSGDK